MKDSDFEKVVKLWENIDENLADLHEHKLICIKVGTPEEINLFNHSLDLARKVYEIYDKVLRKYIKNDCGNYSEQQQEFAQNILNEINEHLGFLNDLIWEWRQRS